VTRTRNIILVSTVHILREPVTDYSMQDSVPNP
jgi:hypothetical protein